MISIITFKAVLDKIDHASQRIKMIGATMMSGAFTLKKGKRPLHFAFAGRNNGQTYRYISTNVFLHLVPISPNHVSPRRLKHCRRLT